MRWGNDEDAPKNAILIGTKRGCRVSIRGAMIRYHIASAFVNSDRDDGGKKERGTKQSVRLTSNPDAPTTGIEVI